MKNLVVLTIAVIFFGLNSNVSAQKNARKKSNHTKNISNVSLNESVKKWEEFVSNEGKFRILFPAASETKTKDLIEGESRLRTVSQRLILPEFSLAASYTDTFSNASVNEPELLESLKKLISENGKLIKTTKINQKGVEGWEIVYEKSGQNIVIHRFFVVGKRWYEVIAQYESLLNESFEISYSRHSVNFNKFFDSFQIEK